MARVGAGSPVGEGEDPVLAYARRAVAHAVTSGRPDPAPPREGRLGEPGAAFVTLRLRDRQLRGCIGRTVAERPLGEVLAAVALSAVREDPRFPPVAPGELPDLLVEVTILGPLVESRDPLAELRVGSHGVQVREGPLHGLLLPQVAIEHRLDAHAFLEAVCRKAGLPPGGWRRPGARVWLFTAEILGGP